MTNPSTSGARICWDLKVSEGGLELLSAGLHLSARLDVGARFPGAPRAPPTSGSAFGCIDLRPRQYHAGYHETA